ncbi:MAG: flagellar hook-length control protein FliK [Heliobacteriaceae bacterium]|nr:flagellar hook-length control protein FliK [Heliobacteriaceae bacterium]
MRDLQLAVPLPLDLPRTNLVERGPLSLAGAGEDSFASLFRDALTVGQKPRGWGKDKPVGPNQSRVDRKADLPVSDNTRSGPSPLKKAQLPERRGKEAGSATGKKAAEPAEPAKRAGAGQACCPPDDQTVATAGPNPITGGVSDTENKVDQGEEPPVLPDLPVLSALGTLPVDPDTTTGSSQGNIRGEPGSEIEFVSIGAKAVDLTGEQAKQVVVGEKAPAGVLPVEPQKAGLPELVGDCAELAGKPRERTAFLATSRNVLVDLAATGRNRPADTVNPPDGLEKPAQLALLAGLHAGRKGHEPDIAGKPNETVVETNKLTGSGQALPDLMLNRVAAAQAGEVTLTSTGETGGDLGGNGGQTPQDGGKETAGRSGALPANGAGLLGLSEQRGQLFENTAKNGYLFQRQEIIRQIVAKVAVFKGPGMNGLTLQLKPEFLGQLHLQVITEDGLVSARFLAENPQVKQLLEGNLTQLKQSLEEQGLRFDRLEVGVGGHGAGFQQGGSQLGFWFGQHQNGSYGQAKWGNQTGVKGTDDGEAPLLDGSEVAVSYRSPDSTVEFLA